MKALKVLEILSGLAVGGIFIYAAWSKILDPGEFSGLIGAYKLFPRWSLNLIAITLPWVEMVAGVMMVTGIFRRPASLAVLALCVGFLFSLGWAMHHGYDISCGCFGGETEHKVGWSDIIRDLLLIAGCLFCLFAPKKRRALV